MNLSIHVGRLLLIVEFGDPGAVCGGREHVSSPSARCRAKTLQGSLGDKTVSDGRRGNRGSWVRFAGDEPAEKIEAVVSLPRGSMVDITPAKSGALFLIVTLSTSAAGP